MPFALIYKPTLRILSLYEDLLFVSSAELFGIKLQTKGFFRKPVSPEKNFFFNATTIWRVSYVQSMFTSYRCPHYVVRTSPSPPYTRSSPESFVTFPDSVSLVSQSPRIL